MFFQILPEFGFVLLTGVVLFGSMGRSLLETVPGFLGKLRDLPRFPLHVNLLLEKCTLCPTEQFKDTPKTSVQPLG